MPLASRDEVRTTYHLWIRLRGKTICRAGELRPPPVAVQRARNHARRSFRGSTSASLAKFSSILASQKLLGGSGTRARAYGSAPSMQRLYGQRHRCWESRRRISKCQGEDPQRPLKRRVMAWPGPEENLSPGCRTETGMFRVVRRIDRSLNSW